MDESLANISLGEEEEQEEKKEEKKDDQNEFQKLVSYVNEALDKEGDRDPLLKIDRVIQLIKDFYKKDEDMGNTNESKEKAKKVQDHVIYRAYCNKNAKKKTDGDKDSAAVEIKLIIERCKKNANSKKEKKKKKGPGQAGTSSVKKLKPSKNNPNLMENLTGNFETDVKLLKGVFKYLQPLIMCHESIKNEMKEISADRLLYFIMRTTRNCLCHWRCFFDLTLISKMYINIKNFYHILGVDLKDKKLQELCSDNNTDDNFYYYLAPGGDKYPNDSNPIITVSRDTINQKIKSLIVRGHSEGEVTNSYSKSIILFGKLLHNLVGTMDTNWSNITGYFAGYKIEPLKDERVNGASSADKAPDQKEEIKNNFNITLKRKNPKDFFFEAIRLKIHWAQMSLRDKDEGAGGSNIGEIRSALAAEFTTQFGDLFREIISEKKEQLKDIIKLFESTDQSGSAYKIGSGGIDVFFEQLIDCKQIAYISSADAAILSNFYPALILEYLDDLKQRNKRLTANFTAYSNRLILCPLEVQNQWFLFVADRKTNQCSLHGCLGNDSVSAPDVQKACETFVSNLRKLPSLENLKNIPKGKYNDKNQPQKIVEECGSFICSLAFNLVYCPLHLYPKDVRRIIMAKIL